MTTATNDVALDQAANTMKKINLKILSDAIHQYSFGGWHQADHSAKLKALANSLTNIPPIKDIEGFKINLSHSRKNCIVFSFYYRDGNSLTKHALNVTPTFGGFELQITGGYIMSDKAKLYESFASIFE